MSASMNSHNITSLKLGAIKHLSGGTFTRKIEIKNDKKDWFEITLFANNRDSLECKTEKISQVVEEGETV